MIDEWVRQGLAKPGKSGRGLAEHLGIDPAQVTRMKKGERRLRLDEVAKAAAYFDEPVPEGLMRRPLVSSFDPDESDPIADRDVVRGEGVDIRANWPLDAVPELVARGGLGSGHTIDTLAGGEGRTVDEVREEYWKFPSSFVRGIWDTTPSAMVVIECEGDSMEPTLKSGERVYVNAAHRTPSPDGVYAIRDAFGFIIIKRLHLAQEKPIRFLIISDNPAHPSREVGADEITVVGKVVASLKFF